jgi:High potential iron-sulfur protein
MKENQMPRRRFLTIGRAALAMIPVMIVAGRTDAATNAALRSGLKYQGTPQGDNRCANCKQFVPGASAEGLGSCVIIPGDTEISPQGYCIAWAKKV